MLERAINHGFAVHRSAALQGTGSNETFNLKKMDKRVTSIQNRKILILSRNLFFSPAYYIVMCFSNDLSQTHLFPLLLKNVKMIGDFVFFYEPEELWRLI